MPEPLFYFAGKVDMVVAGAGTGALAEKSPVQLWIYYSRRNANWSFEKTERKMSKLYHRGCRSRRFHLGDARNDESDRSNIL